MLQRKRPAPSAPSARNDGIDLLRGLAIVLVVLHHTGLRIPLRHSVLASFMPGWSLSAIIYNGYEAVFVFFVISGFLITTNSLARWGSLGAIDAPAFYRRRAGRILPCLLLLVALLGVLHLAGVSHYVINGPKQSLAGATAAALGLVLNWYEGMNGYLPASWDVLWSLSIEEVFYLGFPLLCLLLARRRWFVPALLALALSLPFTRALLASNEVWQEKAYLPGMAAIAMGVLAALVAARQPPERATTVRLLFALGVTGLVATFCFGHLLWPFMHDGSVLLLTFSAAAIVVALLWRKRAAAAPMRRLAWLRSFGRLSYEVYLCHMFAVWWVVDAYRATGLSESWGVVWYLPVLGLSWLLGWLVSRFVSVPAERMVNRRRAARAAVIATMAR